MWTGIFLFFYGVHADLGSTNSAVQWVPVGLSPEIERAGYGAFLAPPSSAYPLVFAWCSSKQWGMHFNVLSRPRRLVSAVTRLGEFDLWYGDSLLFLMFVGPCIIVITEE